MEYNSYASCLGLKGHMTTMTNKQQVDSNAMQPKPIDATMNLAHVSPTFCGICYPPIALKQYTAFWFRTHPASMLYTWCLWLTQNAHFVIVRFHVIRCHLTQLLSEKSNTRFFLDHGATTFILSIAIHFKQRSQQQQKAILLGLFEFRIQNTATHSLHGLSRFCCDVYSFFPFCFGFSRCIAQPYDSTWSCLGFPQSPAAGDAFMKE